MANGGSGTQVDLVAFVAEVQCVDAAVDCSAEALRAAVVGWVSDELGLADPPVSPPGR